MEKTRQTSHFSSQNIAVDFRDCAVCVACRIHQHESCAIPCVYCQPCQRRHGRNEVEEVARLGRCSQAMQRASALAVTQRKALVFRGRMSEILALFDMKRLKRLVISPERQLPLQSLLDFSRPALAHLSLLHLGSPWCNSFAPVSAVFQHCPNLEHLGVDCRAIQGTNNLQILPKLRSLAIRTVSHAGLPSLLAVCPNVKELLIEGPQLAREDIEAIFRLPKLKSLTLASSDGLHTRPAQRQTAKQFQAIHVE